jgi:hypothetical protein
MKTGCKPKICKAEIIFSLINMWRYKCKCTDLRACPVHFYRPIMHSSEKVVQKSKRRQYKLSLHIKTEMHMGTSIK